MDGIHIFYFPEVEPLASSVVHGVEIFDAFLLKPSSDFKIGYDGCTGPLGDGLNIGHMMAALPPSFTALHDRISRTRVYRDAGTAARLPAWAGAWLAMLGAAMLLAGAWLAIAMSAGLQAALERALPGYG